MKSNRIKATLKKFKMTQKDLAAAIGCSQSSVSKAIAGTAPTTLTRIEAYLADKWEEPTPSPSQEGGEEDSGLAAAFVDKICEGTADATKRLALLVEKSDVDEDRVYRDTYQSKEFRALMVDAYERLVDRETAEVLAGLHVAKLHEGGNESARVLSIALVKAGIGDVDVFLDAGGVACGDEFKGIAAGAVEEPTRSPSLEGSEEEECDFEYIEPNPAPKSLVTLIQAETIEPLVPSVARADVPNYSIVYHLCWFIDRLFRAVGWLMEDIGHTLSTAILWGDVREVCGAYAKKLRENPLSKSIYLKKAKTRIAV